MATGYDIIFFWDARMIFSGLAHTGKTPFDRVVLHGLVRDAQGRKMSKSLGNGVDPLEIIEQYGADALRFSLCMGVSPGNDMRFSIDKVEMARNFANKVWNASRFVLMNMDGAETLEGKSLLTPDKWILTKYQSALRDVTRAYEDADYGMITQRLYDFIWSEFCDWYIELAKSALLGDDPVRKSAVRAVLQEVLSGLLRMLHPFMPFLTEELYKNLPAHEGQSCMMSAWPAAEEKYDFAEASARMEGVMDIIRAVRNLRADMNVQPGHKARLMLLPADGWTDTLTSSETYFRRLANVSALEILKSDQVIGEKTVGAVCAAASLFIPLGDLVDLDKERARVRKEYDNLLGEIARSEGKLQNQGFVRKAPPALIEAEKEKLEKNKAMLASLESRMAELNA